MFDTVYVGPAVRELKEADQLNGYSKVVLRVSDNVRYEVGTEEGRTLTLSCPWGTEQMAKNILAGIRGYQYQPFDASGAVLNPAAEPGDAVQIRGLHGGVYNLSATFGNTFRADISAPGEEEIDEQVPYKSVQERQINRRFGQVESQFRIQAGLIEARVSRTGGDASSFGWALDEKSWVLSSGGGTVLKADKDGVEITGKITATSGKIGGFEITADALSYNGQTWGGTNTNGVYIGPYGIQLGKNFRVDSAGNLTAESGTFTGAVRAGSIQYGGDAGYFDGSGLSGHSVTGNEIGYSTIGTPNVNSGIKVPIGYANFSNDVFTGISEASQFRASYSKIKNLECAALIQYNGSAKFTPQTICYIDGNTKEKKYIRVFAN